LADPARDADITLLEYHTLLLDEWHVQHEFTEKQFTAFLPPQLHPSVVYYLRKKEYLDQLPSGLNESSIVKPGSAIISSPR